MLALLRVENLTVIEQAEIEFSKGLNIITGETGAGKSVLLGALKLLLGERFNRTLFRDESKKIVIEGIFGGSFEDIAPESAEQFQVEHELIIRREIDSAGKNRIYINGMLATAAQLKDIAAGLADIHGQHDNQKLLNPACHMEFIDSYVDFKFKNEYKGLYAEYSSMRRELESLKKNHQSVVEQKDMLEYQLNEIDALEINVEEDSKIDDKVKVLSNMDKIRNAMAESLVLLRDGEVNASEMLGRADSVLSGAAMGEEIESLSEQLSGVCYSLSDVCNGLESILDTQELDPAELERLTNRKYKLQDLMGKYSCNLEELIEKGIELRDKVENIFFDERKIKKLEAEVSEIEAKVAESAEILNDERALVASKLSEKVVATLEELELKNSVFRVDFQKQEVLDSSAGMRAEFMISTNPGFEAGPLARVASGGEISRVMLALKDVFAEADSISTLVFDEIDTGISGFTAKRVADKLKNISLNKQVIVITHLPVVAAKGDRHFHITKGADAGVARTEIGMLENLEREEILASMIAGSVSESSVKQARELLEG